jgi:hypothetical protein
MPRAMLALRDVAVFCGDSASSRLVAVVDS